MSRKSIFTGIATIAVIVLSANPLVMAQMAPSGVNPPGTTALEDVSGGALAGRSPGRMVQEGVGRHEDFGDFDFGITEVEGPSPKALALAEVFDVFFEELNNAIDAFTALLLARSGNSPLSSFSGIFGSN